MNTRYVMGTFLTVRISGQEPERLTRIFFDDIQRLEKLLSFYLPDSDIARINRRAAAEPVQVHEDTAHVIRQALRFAERSEGAFDPTLQPFGYRRVILDDENKTVRFLQEDLTLNLGGIGKGFALDQALARVQREGRPESVSANFGGQLLFWHASGSFGPETVVIENPDPNGGILSQFQISSNGSISTSSQAERPGHLRDPRTGKAAAKNRSVTVIAPTGTEAEVWSTALFVQGLPHCLERYGAIEIRLL